jgi:mono/diheme cytochrome c family protein
MKTIYSRVVTLALLVSFSVVLMSQTQKQEAWSVPDNYKTMKNPVKADNSSVNIGKTLYMKNCASCHGKTGLGDGPKAKSIKTSSGDFTADTYQSQTDGEHFYKTKFGRGDMPKYDKKIPDEDIWSIINYMRTLKK